MAAMEANPAPESLPVTLQQLAQAVVSSPPTSDWVFRQASA